ncbi:hypothetical protein ESZ53_00920 [Salinibacterium sp. UTAS2018]|uniref:hypothetical protein n=1 Tax=unclassified Salinibacterium TaxID=2632331 RepID=UPI0010097A1B|nr:MULTISPECIES: hypothetical protein [unclassified Salinibacterium]MBH0010284.1 hypothetical protein [Salinibacterium sp. SWN1162]QAV69127.1 hypothetical protein ESZ53_00920 [Salinibacterium sp. UTAS2018]
MTKSQTLPLPRWAWVSLALYSVTIIAVGLWASIATGEWIALVSASGLVVLPLGVMAYRQSSTQRQPE